MPHPAFLIGGGFGIPNPCGMSGFSCVNITDAYSSGGGVVRGADSTGSLDSTVAIQHYLDTTQGGYIYAPRGTYRLKSDQLVYRFNNQVIFGDGYGGGNGTTFTVDDTGGISGKNAFKCSDLRNCGLIRSNISATSTRAAGYAVQISGGDSSVQIATTSISANQFQLDVDMDSQFSGVLVSDSTVGAWNVMLGSDRYAIWRDFNVSGDGVLFNAPKGASFVMQNIFLSKNSASPFNSGVRLQGAGDLKVLGVDVLGAKNGFLLDNSNPIAQGGGGVCNVKIDHCEFDNTGAAVGSDCIRLVPTNITQPINIEASNLWCSSGYNGIFASGFSGNLCSFSLANATIVGQNQYGIRGVSPVDTGNIVIGNAVYYGRGAQANSVGNSLFGP